MSDLSEFLEKEGLPEPSLNRCWLRWDTKEWCFRAMWCPSQKTAAGWWVTPMEDMSNWDEREHRQYHLKPTEAMKLLLDQLTHPRKDLYE
jgi:hypothetical protein